MPLIYLIAGEQSGDVLGARLMQAIRRQRPDVDFAGIGGTDMVAQGLVSLFPIRELAVMGLLEVLPRIRRLRGLLRQAVADVQARRPDVLVTIDSPGFTLRVLRGIAGTGIPRVHYVAPQVWAWRESRVKSFPGLWDKLLCLLPFEPAFFARHGLPATFVGHPVLESGAELGDAERFRTRFGVAADDRVVTIMPGSRRSEVARLLPLLRDVLGRLPEQIRPEQIMLERIVPGQTMPEQTIPGRIVPVVPVAGPVEETVRAHTASWPLPPILVSTAADKYDAFAASAAALTKSGTSTLELALAGVPMLVTYRVNPVSYQIARRLVKVRYASILNLVLNREVVPELLQNDATADRLSEGLQALLTNPSAAARQRAGFAEALAMLRPANGTSSEQAAREVLGLLR